MGRPGKKEGGRGAEACRTLTHSYDASQGYAALRGQEWVLSNGLGGFAMGTAAGVPTRRYHAMLIGATKPPVGRVAALNAMVERVEFSQRVVEFATLEFKKENDRSEPVVHPDGISRLCRFEFEQGVLARWVYGAEGLEFTRELVLYAGMSRVGLRYTLRRAGALGPMKLTVRPLLSLRDFHGLLSRAWAGTFAVSASKRDVEVGRNGHRLGMKVGAGAVGFVHDEQWWNDCFYREDSARGQDCIEDLFSPGHFEGVLAAEQDAAVFEIAACMGDGEAPEHGVELEMATRRARGAALAAATVPVGAAEGDAQVLGALARSADAFVVARQDRGAEPVQTGVSTIAGYPWFSDWGRDTFISLPGLLLATGRFDDAARELEGFARARRNGIIPNVFNDQTGEPEFNTADASLWFVHAACRWLEATGDRAGFESRFLESCLDVVQSYRRGTDFNIAMDPIDKLITAGTGATQLTWMDAQRDGVTFTPRHGKAVEINALWYNALRSLAGALSKQRGTMTADLSDLAGAVGRSFAAKFWNAKDRCLFDVLTPGEPTGWTPDASVRPNQVFAASLPHSALSIEQRRAVIACVTSRLLTPMGVRTLDPADPRYRGRYEGTLFERDSAYHQGTAWPWLLGPLAEAVLRAGEFSAASRVEARSLLEPVLHRIAPGPARAANGTCIGQIAEVYDGDWSEDQPQRAGGCPAQAWSIAEALRVLKMICA